MIVWVVLMAMAASPAAAPDSTVDFDSAIAPLLTKAGCNAAACHGAAAGRGGFKLSLFGGDPAADHNEIVFGVEGRRVNLMAPAESLLIAKPTEAIEHGGGQRLEFEGPEQALFERWIAEGALRRESPRVTRLDVAPPEIEVSVQTPISWRVFATFADGSRRDVSDVAVYVSADDASLEVDSRGVGKALRRGRHVLIVRFLTEVTTATVTAPMADTPPTLEGATRGNWIDDEILATLAALRIPPSAQADDATLLRRVHLDLTGRLPPTQLARDYPRDTSVDKYERLVETLLESEEFAGYWAFRLRQLLRVGDIRDDAAASAFQRWLARCVQDDVGWDEIVARLLLGEGDSHDVGPANFYRVTGDARAQAEYFSETILGARLRCANCHNHPLDRWTQDDYHGLAAIFARVDQSRVVRERGFGQVIHPATGAPAVARVPGGAVISPGEDGRRALLGWISQGDNPYFARAMVNRVWRALMGRGLIEPVDDLRATNPATHPKLLDRLARDYASHRYSTRELIRWIVLSAAYQRSAATTEANAFDDRYHSHALVEALEPEVLLDALCDATGTPLWEGESNRSSPRAIELDITSQPESDAGRAALAQAREIQETGADGLAARLNLLNGPFLNARIADPRGRLRRLLAADADNDRVVQEFYLAALGRPPTADEAEKWSRRWDPSADRVSQLEDFVWALLNSREFLTRR